MDIFAHGLWTAALSRTMKEKLPRFHQIQIWRATFWGIFPDLFAFFIPFVWTFAMIILGKLDFSSFRIQHAEPAAQQIPSIFQSTAVLYSMSHSLIVFTIIFGISMIIFCRPVWEMLGWLFHILIDIPTHSYQFYPTPIFWPVSAWKFRYGISWATPWFMIVNYSALLLVYGWFFIRYRHRKKSRLHLT
ncbi:MAG TPA: hypothetical protein VFQ60_02450 [Patescibacteria group bacterium]|nr:hypothetical protein [Patescibacteria group bacterium]